MHAVSITPSPSLSFSGTGLAIAVVFSCEQASDVMRDSMSPLLLLCVDVPRARYCDSVAEAFEFYKGSE